MLDKEKADKIISKKSKSGSTYKTFYFKCLNCNNEIKAQNYQLNTHSGKCRSCTQQGIPYKHIYNELINHHNRKINIDLSFEEFLELIESKKCHYCNKDIIFNKHSKENNKGISRAYQLDRKNNDIGYIKNNLVVCCWVCNRLKSDYFTYDEFIKLSPILKEIRENRNE